MPNIGPLELVVVLAIVLLIFGPKRLPAAGRALGRSMREFKDSISGNSSDSETLEAPDRQESATRKTDQEDSQPTAARDRSDTGSD